jgi:enamine deaminase RidA (YjgF/YER057c/UK114 family)
MRSPSPEHGTTSAGAARQYSENLGKLADCQVGMLATAETLLRVGGQAVRLPGMSPAITRINPAGLHPTPGYHHITVVEAGRTAHLAGQCPLDPFGAVVGVGDLDAQIDQVAANAVAALAAVGAGPEHIVRSVIYVVSAEPKVLGAAWQRLTASPLAAAFTTASTLLGVAQLGFPDQLVEVDLTAALPD